MRGVARQRSLHGGLAEGHAGLQQVAAVSAQYHDFAGLQTGDQQQPVEAVVLDIAAPGGEEGVREVGFDSRNFDGQAVAVLDLEVLDPGGCRLRARPARTGARR